VKLLLNAAASEKAKLLVLDLTDFYLGTESEIKEYMVLTRDQIPKDVQQEYHEQIEWRGDKCVVQVNNTIYGVPYAFFFFLHKSLGLFTILVTSMLITNTPHPSATKGNRRADGG
jgi:hypothetical protein